MSTLLTVTRQGFSIVLLGVLAATSVSFAADRDLSWPQFHGPNRDNISAETGLLKKWPDKGPPLLWTADGLGHGFSSVSIAAGRIYTAGNIEKETVVTALDLDGKVLWRAVNGRAWTNDKYYPGARSTPTIDGNRVYHQSPLGNIVCLEAKTGDIVWELDILNKVGSKNSRWALAESLLIDGDHVISCPGGPETCMVALNKNTGEIVWKAPSTGELAGYSSPILVRHEGLRIIITMTAKAIIGVNTDSGQLLWHVKHESHADENVMIPIFYDGHVFISTLKAGSVKWKINVEDGKASLEEVWRTEEMDNHHGGVILLDGNLYGTSTIKNSKKWISLDWQTGQNKFMHEGVGKGSLTYADGMLYTLSIDRVMGLVRPTPSGLELVSSFEIPKGGKGKSWAHPVVCGGRLYIRHGDFLYAYGIEGVDITPDVVYGHKHGMALTFDVFKPKQANGAGILHIVSGGWYSGWRPPEKSVGGFKPMLDKGFTVFTVRHGSSPKYAIPEIIEDVRRSVRFIRLRANKFGVDPERLGVTGASAGGHLSLMLGTASDKGVPGSADEVLRTSNRVAAVVAYFPPTDIRPWVNMAPDYPALNFEEEKAAACSPLLHVSDDDPPTLLIHGDKDELVTLDHSENILAKFKERKVTSKLLVIKGAAHGFRGEDAKRASQAQVAWFEKHLLKE